MKLLVLLFIFVGEAVAIGLEIGVAGKFRSAGSFPEVARYLLLVAPVGLVSIWLLLVGYLYGYRSFEKIWVVTIISWSSIVIIEPVLNYLVFRETPAGNTLVGAALALAASWGFGVWLDGLQ